MSVIRELQASFVASARGLTSTIRNVRRDIRDLADDTRRMSTGASRSFENIGESLRTTGRRLERVGDDFQKAGKGLTKSITAPAVAAASALAGITLAKGFARLVGIDTARAKLKGLGHDAEGVELIMTSALDAVRGTSFGMDEAATTAAGAVAAGVKPGKDLTKYLTTTGDAAAIAGVSLGEMGSIINKVQTSQVAYTDNLNQLADRGIPIYQWLAEEAGVSMEEVKKMTSDGEISSDLFLKSIEKNIGGAAGIIGAESFTAGIANAWSAVGRLGANFLDAGGKGGGFFSQLKPLIADFTENIDNMGEMAEKAGEKFGIFFMGFVDKVKAAKAAYDELSPTMQNIIKKVALFGSVGIVALGPLILMIGKFISAIGLIMKPLAFLFTGLSKVFGAIGSHGLGGGLKLLAGRFSFLFGPVGIAIGIITTLATIFILAYKKSETFRNFVDKLKDSFIAAYEKVKEFLTTNKTLLKFIDSIKKGFETLKDNVSKAIEAVVSFFKVKFGEMKAFWDSDGKTLLEAVSNIFNAIWKVIKPIIDAIVAIVKVSLPIIQAIFSVAFKVILAVIKSVWGNIKGVIDGGLKIIMGLIQVFSGLFTGNFSKMWEGIKNLFFGAIQLIWNFVQLMFWGKLLKGVVGFIKGFSGPIGAMWTGIKKVFSTVIKWIAEFVKSRFATMRNTISTVSSGIQKFISTVWNAIFSFFKFVLKGIVNFIKSRLTNIKNNVTTIFNAVKNFITTVWNTVYSFFKVVIKKIVDFIKTRLTNIKNNVTTIFNNVKNFISTVWNTIFAFFKVVIKKIVDFIKSRLTNIKNNVTTIFNAVKDFVKKVWDNIKNSIINPIKSAVKTAIDKFKELKTKISNTFKDIKDKVFGYVADMVKKVKDMPGNMKKGITSMAHKVFEGMKSLANKMQDGLKKGVNGVITGVNWVMGKLNVPKDKHLGKWSPKKLAQGTDSHEGGDAILGDGRGSNAGSELVRLPNGQQFMSASKDTLYPNLPKGTQVISAKNTRKYLESVPAYKNGKGILNKVISKGKAVGEKVAGWAGNVWDYVKNPGKLLDIAMKTLGVSLPDSASTFGKVASGGFNKVKESAIEYVKGKLSELTEAGSDDSGGGSGGGGPVSFGSLRKTSSYGMRFHPIHKQWRLHAGDDYGGKVGTAIRSTTSGKVDYAGRLGGFGNFVRIRNGAYTYGYAHLSRIMARLGEFVKKGQVIGALGSTGDSTGPHLHYEVRKNGSPIRPGAYKDGGIVNQKQLAWIADGGWAESIISHDPSKRNRQEKIWKQTGDTLGFSEGKDNKEMLYELRRIAEAVENERDITMVMNDREIGRAVEKHVTERQQRNENSRLAF